MFGLADGTTRGGHLLEGHVWPTLEVIIQEAPAELRKVSRPELGLALIDLSASGQAARELMPAGTGAARSPGIAGGGGGR